MVIQMNVKYTGSKLAAAGVKVEVQINEDVVSNVAQKLAVTMCMSNNSVGQLIEVDEAKECFAYALRVVLCQNSGAKPSFDLVPQFLSDITHSLEAEYRGVRIHVSAIEPPERPNSYELFLDVLSSIGVPSGKVLKVDPYETTNVLKSAVIDVNGVPTLVGVNDDMTIEELIVRAMLEIPQKEADKISRIVGHMDYLYVSRDELVRQWACSLPAGQR